MEKKISTLGQIERLEDAIEFLDERDKDEVVLAVAYFWLKYQRRNINQEGFEPDVSSVKEDDPLYLLRIGFLESQQLNKDFEGNPVEKIGQILVDHPDRQNLFPNLGDRDIYHLLTDLEGMFENQEFCANSESWSYYLEEQNKFATFAAADMLWLAGSRKLRNFFQDLLMKVSREEIVETITRERLDKKLESLLGPKES